MADIVINPAIGKIDFFTTKGESVTNTLRLTGNTLLVTGPLSASSISTGGGGAFVTSVQPTTNYLSKFTGNSTIANSVIYDNGTNVGIGSSSPVYKLDVNGIIASAGVAIAWFSGNYNRLYEPAGNPALYLGNNSDPANYYDNNTHFFRNRGGSSTYAVIEGNGNLGIGTTSVTAPLHIYRASNPWIRLNGGGSFGYIRFDDGTSNGYLFKNTSSDTTNGALAGAMYTYTDSNKAFQHIHSGTPLFTILSGGSIGIGSTAPSYKLEVYSGAKTSAFTGLSISNFNNYDGTAASLVTSQLRFAILENPTGTYNAPTRTFTILESGNEANNSSSDGFFAISTRSGGTVAEKLRLNSAGNLGIGTTNPTTKLAISDGTTIAQVNPSSGVAYFGSVNNYPVALSVNSSEKVRIISDGNVGIGTTSIPSPLTVYSNGDVWHFRLGSATGELRFGGQTSSGAVIQSYTPGGVVRDLYIQRDGGNIGVGTNAATARLHLVAPGNDGAPALRIVASGSDTFNWASSTMYANLTAGETAIHLIGKAQSQYNSAYLGFRHVSDGSSSNMLSLGLYAADYLVNILGSGNVGIGTTSPAYKLDVVSGSIRASSGAYAGELYFGTNSNADLYLKRDNNYDLSLVQNASSGNGLYLAGAGNVYLSIDSNNNETTSAFIVQNNAIKAGTELFRVNEAGSVGIGTSSPGYKLDVGAVGSNSVSVRLTPGYERVRYYGFDLLGYNDGNLWMIGNNATNALILGSNWDWDSQIAIAYTPGTFGASGGSLEIGQVTKNNANFTHGNTRFYTNGIERLRIISSGNVGVGTTSPTAKFQVGTHSTGDAGNGDNSANVRIGAASAGARVFGMTLANTAAATLSNESALSFVLAGNYSSTGIISALLRNTGNAATDLIFTNYNSSLQERMRILYDGNVGIGTSAPAYKLDVSGTGFASSDFRAPIFYDSANTSYYVDPASTSNLVGLTVANTITGNISGNAGGNAAGSSTFVASLGSNINYDSGSRTTKRSGLSHYSGYSTGTNRPTTYDYTLQVTDGNKGWEISMDWIATTGPAIYARSLRDCCQNWSTWVRILDSANYTYAANMNQYVRTTDNVTHNIVDATQFRDSANTSYYLDPASTSVLNVLSLSILNNMNPANGTWHTSAEGKARFYFASNSNTYFRTGADFIYRNNSDSGVLVIDSSGNLRTTSGGDNSPSYSLHVGGTGYAVNDFRAPIFYDSNDTGYYGDFASTSRLNILNLVSYAYINGQTLNGQSFYQWEGATYRNPGDHTPQLLIRKDNSTTGINGFAPALALYNNNGADQTTVGMTFVSAEAVSPTQGNSVELAGIIAKKESTGTAGAWSRGSLNFYTKDFGTRKDVMYMSPDGTVTVTGTDNNSGKADFSVDTGGTATMALSGQYFRVGSTDVNWAMKMQSNGYLATYGQQFDIATVSGDNAITFATNGTNRVNIGGSVTETVKITGYANYIGNYGYNTLTLIDTSGYPGLNYRSGNNNWLMRMDGGGTYSMNWSSNASAKDVGTFSTPFYFGTTGTAYASNDFRAPIFYDANDTSYYVDPNSASVLNGLRLVSSGNQVSGGDYSLWIQGGNEDWGIGIIKSSANYGITYNLAASHTYAIQGNKNGTEYFRLGTDMLYHDTRVQAPIFYDSADTAYYLDPASTTTSLQIAGAIEQGNDLARPLVQWGVGGDTTGMIIIKLPGTSSNYGMIHAVIDIYEYSSNNVATIIVGGHNWNGAWYNIGANVVGYTNKTVRLGFKDGQYCIVLGGASSVWSYGQVVLRKIQNGSYYTNNMNLGGTYSISQTATESFTYVSGDLTQLRTPGTFIAYGDVRAPIFYDSANTSYYLDPASTSVLYSIAAGAAGNSSANIPALKVTSAGTATTQAAIAIQQQANEGDTIIFCDFDQYVEWNLVHENAANQLIVHGGSSTGNLGSNTFYSPNGTAKTGYIKHVFDMTDGNAYIGGSVGIGTNGPGQKLDVRGTIISNADVRAPLFYDSANTAYYVDPNGVSNLYGVAIRGDVAATNTDNQIFFWGTGNTTTSAIGFKSNGGAFPNPTGAGDGYNTYFTMDYEGRGWVFRRGAGGSDFSAAYTSGWILNNGVWQANASMRAPIFYDSANTTYYIDPGSTTSLRTVGSWRSDSAAWDGEFNGKIQYHANHWYFQSGDLWLFRNSGGSNVVSISQGGIVNLSGITGAGNTYIQTSTTGTAYTSHFQIREANGGASNTSEIYAPALGFHWAGVVASNILMEASGRIAIRNNPGSGYENFIAAIVYAGSSVQAPIFYDSNDTTYYLDPAASTSLNIAGQITTAKTNGTLLSIAGADTIGYNSTAGRGAYIKGTGSTYVYGSAIFADGANFRQMLYEDTWLNNKYFASNGVIYSAVDIRAPIFYDYNDTGYYLDPNGGSVLKDINAGIVQPYSGTTGSDIYARDAILNSYYHGDALTYDVFQFNAASLYEIKLTSTHSFSSTTVETSIFKGDRFGGMTIANNTYQVRWTWSNTIGYKFFKTLYIANSTNGNSFSVTIEYSGNGSTWTTLATSGQMSNWPGHSWYNYNWNNNAAQGYIRLTITPVWSTVYDINIYNMRYFASYNLDAATRLYDWDYSRNVTFAVSLRAPIFYDSANTSYYVDPASTSNLVGLTVANTITGNISGTAGGENLTTISGRGNITSTQLIVSTAAGQAMYIGRQIGGGYSYGSAGIFTALSDNTNGGSNIFFQGYVGSTSNTPGGTLTYSIRADGQIYTTSNSATGVANNSFNVGRTILGALHIANGSGTSGNNNQAAITFQGDSNTQAQAGIYVSNNSSTGTAMGFATTDDYAAGPKLFMTATNAGVVNFPRSRPTYAGNTIIDTAYSGTVSGLNIGGTAVNLSTTRTNWSTNGTITAVVGQLCWKNYGNNHTIIDASNSTSPAGGSINNTNPDVAWTGTYPTLMGWNGANTYGVRVDSCRYADQVGYSPSRTDSTAYPVLWGSGTTYTNAYSCAAVTIQSSTGTLNATNVNVSGKLVQNSTTQSITGTGQTLTLNVATAAVQVISMASGATITTISYTNRDNNPSVNTIMLVVKYAGTASITFTNVLWANGTAPTLTGTNGYADVFMLTSYQGGAGTPVWIGTVVAQALVSTNL